MKEPKRRGSRNPDTHDSAGSVTEPMTDAQDDQGERHLQPPVRREGDEGVPQGDIRPGGEPGDEIRDGHREAERGEVELPAVIGPRALPVVHVCRLHASSLQPRVARRRGSRQARAVPVLN